MKTVRVLQIAPGFKYGGIESRMVDWYSAIDRDKVHFDVLKVTPEEPNVFVDRMRALGAVVISIPSLRKPIKHLVEMRKIVLHGNYDIIHSHSLFYSAYPFFLAKTHGIRTRILHSRTTRCADGKRHLVNDIICKMAIPFATHYFACSEAAGVYAFGKKVDFRVINNGICLERFMFDKKRRVELRKEYGIDDCFVLGNVGRFASGKNLLFLVEILKELSKETEKIRLMLVGNDLGENVEARLREKAKLLDVEDKVIFAGKQEKPEQWLPAFDMFLFPSFYEGFGTVAIEAQANGLPCVISTGVPRDVQVSDNVTFISPDDLDAWVEVIKMQIGRERKEGNIEKIIDMGYDVNQTAKWLEEFYIVNGKKKDM